MARPPSAPPASGAWHALLPAFACACLFAIVVWGAHGPRGSDQFQYVADAETLARGAPPRTNLHFAGGWLRSLDGGPPANLMSHNGPILHAVAALVPTLGGYRAWIAANVGAHLVVAACVWSLARRLRGSRAAGIATAAYLLSPIALWQVMNPLQEVMLSMLLALALLGFARRTTPWGEPLLAGALLAGVASHPLFVPPALLYPMFRSYEVRARPRAMVHIGAMLALLAAVLIVRASTPGFFPTSFQPNLAAIIASAVPGGSNMYWQLGLELPRIDAELLFSKLSEALRKHFASPANAPFYVYLNASLAALCWLLWQAVTRRRPIPRTMLPRVPDPTWRAPLPWPLLLAVALPIALYVAMVVLQQSHARFAQIVAPASFVAIVAALPARFWNARRTAVGASLALVASVALGAIYAHELREQANADARGVATLRASVAELPPDARLAMLDVPAHGAFAWAVRPRPLLVLRSDLMDARDVDRALASFAPMQLYMPAPAETSPAGAGEGGTDELMTIVEPFGGIVRAQPTRWRDVADSR